MKGSIKFLMLGAILVLVAALAINPLTAQEAEEGSGGIIIDSTFGGDPATLNPLLTSDVTSQDLANLLYPGLLGVDPSLAVIVPRSEAPAEFQGGYLVDSWEVSDDGKVYTFHMRDDYTWSDGTPVTTADVAYAWDAIQTAADGSIDVQAVFVLDFIESVDVIDDYTFSVTFFEPTCTALNYAGSLGSPLAPAHALGPVEGLNEDPFNLDPSVVGGPFGFGELRAGEQVSLIGNTEYPDGDVLPEGYILRQVPDATIQVEQFLAGEVSYIRDPSVGRRADVRARADAGDAQVFSFPGNSWDYLGLNLADPTNPQNALDENGELIDQGNHPIFGDVQVRRAISQAIDVEAIIEAAVFGEGARMTSFIIPSSWAYNNDLPPIAYDPDAAAALLDEAGWIDDDDDPSTPRVASGAMYAEDGTPLTFTLYTNEGNTRREAIGTVIQDQLAQVGIDVDFQTIDFNTLLDIMDAQTFDAFILGWRNGYPDDPDVTQLFTSAGDILAGGSNNTSYYNADFEELNTLANTATETNNCDPAARAEMYYEMQEIFQQDLPYIPLFALNGMYAAQANVQGFAPYPSQPFWNLNSWAVATP